MSVLVKPLAPHMLLAVFLGVAGFLCAIYIPYFSALLISHIAIQAADFPIGVFFVIMLVLAFLRGILHYGEQACNSIMTKNTPFCGIGYSPFCVALLRRGWRGRTREI